MTKLYFIYILTIFSGTMFSQKSDYSIIKEKVTEDLKEWTKKSVYEKRADWQQRIIVKTDSVFQKSCDDAFISRIKSCCHLLLGEYNAETETFPFQVVNENGTAINGTAKVPIKYAKNAFYDNGPTLNNELGLKWRFVKNNLFPIEFMIDTAHKNYKIHFVTEIVNAEDNTNISFVETQYENKPEISLVYNFNEKNQAEFEKIRKKVSLKEKYAQLFEQANNIFNNENSIDFENLNYSLENINIVINLYNEALNIGGRNDEYIESNLQVCYNLKEKLEVKMYEKEKMKIKK